MEQEEASRWRCIASSPHFSSRHRGRGCFHTSRHKSCSWPTKLKKKKILNNLCFLSNCTRLTHLEALVASFWLPFLHLDCFSTAFCSRGEETHSSWVRSPWRINASIAWCLMCPKQLRRSIKHRWWKHFPVTSLCSVNRITSHQKQSLLPWFVNSRWFKQKRKLDAQPSPGATQ